MGGVRGLLCAAGLRGNAWLFATDLGGGLVFAKTLEGGLAEEVVGGPGGKVDLGYELRLHPDRAAPGLSRWLVEGDSSLVQCIELVAEDAVSFLRKAGTCAASVDESLRRFLHAVFVVFVVSEEQRAD